MLTAELDELRPDIAVLSGVQKVPHANGDQLAEVGLLGDMGHRDEVVRQRFVDDSRPHLRPDLEARFGHRVDPHLDEVHPLAGEIPYQ